MRKIAQHKLGWRRDLPDHRDFQYEHQRLALEKLTLPAYVDLRKTCPPIWDQGNLGSCTAHGIAALVEFDRIKEKVHVFTPSRLFIYWNERALEGSVDEDAGAAIRDGIKVVASVGYAEEYLWPYDISKFRIRPPQMAYDRAKQYKALTYYAMNNANLYGMQTCLAAGFPIVFGCTVYDSFYEGTKNGGFIPMPSPNENVLGGHCMLIVGYNNAKSVFIVRNSWGTGVGDRGYFYMPYNYICSTGLTGDCWTIRSVI